MPTFNNEAERARLEADRLSREARHNSGNFPNEPAMTTLQPDRLSPLPAPDQPTRLADLTIPHGVKRVILEF